MSAMKSKQLRKVLAFLTVFSMIFVSTTTGFAASNGVESQTDEPLQTDKNVIAENNDVITDVSENEEDLADEMSEFVEEDEIIDELDSDGSNYSVEGEVIDVSIPKAGDGSIVMDYMQEEPTTIAMELPVEVDDVKAEKTENGTVIYNPEDEAMAIGVQALSGGKGNNSWEAVRVLISISDNDASKEYDFKYTLPEDYKLISAEEWYNQYIKTEEANIADYVTPGEVYVVDDVGTVIETIDPAWAKDANGNAVPTHYEIRGDELVQIVDFNENSAFPVIADPTKHPNKTITKTITRKKVREIRDSYSTSGRVRYIMGAFSIGATFVVPQIGLPWTMATFNGMEYNTRNYDLWNKVYVKMLEKKKKSVKMTVTYKWHSGHKSYYPSSKKVKFSY